jgi:hypothetical protein
MRRLPVLGVVLIAAACARDPQPDHQAEWRKVLDAKKAAAAPAAPPQAKQVYADSLSAFVRRHPNHGRAREVYHRIQLEFARDLAALGRHQDAIRFYRAVLNRDPRNETARRGLAASAAKLAVSRDRLLMLEKGMTHKEVAAILGKPIPGWTVTNRRRETVTEAWYYRTTVGGVAGVYFRDGKVFAAEENSQARFGL